MKAAVACFLACMLPFASLALSDEQARGPDFWEVSNLRSGTLVNLRKGASSDDVILQRLTVGTILRNRGCKVANGQRWCDVELMDDRAKRGWIAGRFLREVASGKASNDALVPATKYNAVGRVPCKLAKAPVVADCAFGVMRGAPGVATVFVTLPDGSVRVLGFDNGRVAPPAVVTSFETLRDGDSWRIKVNGEDEIYLVPDAVVLGG